MHYRMFSVAVLKILVAKLVALESTVLRKSVLLVGKEK